MAVEGHHDLAGPATRRTATAAPLWRRLVASIVDGAVELAPVVVMLLIPVHGFPHAVLGLLGFVGTLAAVIWNSIVLVAGSGQSLGLRWLGIQLLDSGRMTPPRVGQIIWRGFISGGGIGIGIPWHPFFLPSLALMINPWPFICYAFAFTDQRWHRGLNDRWAHTVVIDLLPDWRPLSGRRVTRPA